MISSEGKSALEMKIFGESWTAFTMHEDAAREVEKRNFRSLEFTTRTLAPHSKGRVHVWRFRTAYVCQSFRSFLLFKWMARGIILFLGFGPTSSASPRIPDLVISTLNFPRFSTTSVIHFLISLIYAFASFAAFASFVSFYFFLRLVSFFSHCDDSYPHIIFVAVKVLFIFVLIIRSRCMMVRRG